MTSPPRDCPDCDYALEEHRSSERSIMAAADTCSLTQEELQPGYTCRFCQAESYNSNNVMMRHCGACGRYDDEPSEVQLVHSKEEFVRVFGKPPRAFLDADVAFLTSKRGDPRALGFVRAIANDEPVDPKKAPAPTDTETLKNLFQGPMAPKVAWLAAAADDCWEVIAAGAKLTPPIECPERNRQIKKAAKLLHEAAECLKRAGL